jgi:hypothetical protein
MKLLQSTLVGALALVLLSLAMLPPVYMATLQPAYAQETACNETYDYVTKYLDDNKIVYHVLTPEELTAFVEQYAKGLEGVTRGFVGVTPQGKYVLGLEKDGCMLPPMFIAPPPNPKLSGRYPFGTYA